ncbi:MAG: rod-binding protein [Terracidiphilus sp.]|jgi:Rod binding domain-containing protein
MSDLSAIGAISPAVTEPINLNANKLLHQAPSTSTENAKIDKSSKDFESILLSSWLQQAEQSFGSLPGSENEDDLDSGKEQFQGIAMQSLGASLTASGGIGIAKMIAKSLHKAEDARVALEATTHSPPAK